MGISMSTCQTYVSEISPPKLRTILLGFYPFMIVSILFHQHNNHANKLLLDCWSDDCHHSSVQGGRYDDTLGLQDSLRFPMGFLCLLRHCSAIRSRKPCLPRWQEQDRPSQKGSNYTRLQKYRRTNFYNRSYNPSGANDELGTAFVLRVLQGHKLATNSYCCSAQYSSAVHGHNSGLKLHLLLHHGWHDPDFLSYSQPNWRWLEYGMYPCLLGYHVQGWPKVCYPRKLCCCWSHFYWNGRCWLLAAEPDSIEVNFPKIFNYQVRLTTAIDSSAYLFF
jgi:hypothetical protein